MVEVEQEEFNKRRNSPNLSDCHFYHSFDLPDGSQLIGDWDMRGKFDEYVGYLPLEGKTVIDFGAASGFLSFEAEKRGAKVTSFDADSTARYCRLPHTPSRYTHDREASIALDNKWLDGVKNSYWYVYNALKSHNRVFYGDLYNLPQEIGTFDVAILGQFLVHNRSAIDVLEVVASKAKQYVVITEGIWDIDEPGAKLLGSASSPDDFYSNWLYSPPFYSEIMGMLGFERLSFDRRYFRCNHAKHMRDEMLGVFVFKRVR